MERRTFREGHWGKEDWEDIEIGSWGRALKDI